MSNNEFKEKLQADLGPPNTESGVDVDQTIIVDHDKVIGTYEPPTTCDTQPKLSQDSLDDKLNDWKDNKACCSDNNNPSSYMTAAFRAQSNDDSNIDTQSSNQTF